MGGKGVCPPEPFSSIYGVPCTTRNILGTPGIPRTKYLKGSRRSMRVSYLPLKQLAEHLLLSVLRLDPLCLVRLDLVLFRV